MEKLRDFFRSPYGLGTAGVVGLVGLIVVIVGLRDALGLSDPNSQVSSITCIDATDGQTFSVPLEAGIRFPVEGPSGQKTGYPAEQCFWTADGEVKSSPTYVLMNTFKGETGATFCPDCGRRVVTQNPLAVEGNQPPPTKDELNSEKSPRP